MTTVSLQESKPHLFKVTFYWLIGKLSLSSFIPAPNFWKIRKIRWVKNYWKLFKFNTVLLWWVFRMPVTKILNMTKKWNFVLQNRPGIWLILKKLINKSFTCSPAACALANFCDFENLPQTSQTYHTDLPRCYRQFLAQLRRSFWDSINFWMF